MVSVGWKKLRKYAGQWVAVWKNKIIAHGEDGKLVYQQALQKCKTPRIFQVPDETDEVYILWKLSPAPSCQK